MNDRDALASALAWWAQAGVDALVEEAPRNWLAKAPPPRAPTPAPTESPLPNTLAGLQHLLATAELPDAGPPARRVAPAGDPAAGLMILLDMPEASDADAGSLLSGEAGALFDRMLAAIGRDRASVYLASVTPGRPPSGMIAEEAMPRLAELARLHVALAAPRRLLLLGKAASRACLGIDDTRARGTLHAVNQNESIVEAVASFHPRLLLQTPRFKALAWADLQLLMRGFDA